MKPFLFKSATASACLVAAMPMTAAGQLDNSSEDSVRVIDKVVVTARKRAETAQDVPMAVTAVSGADIEARGYDTAEDLFAVTPGLYFSQRGQRNNDEQFFLTIRGIGSSPVVEPSVGVFVDGVYVPSLGWSADFLDLERVEVLRGPQGSLFGRNTQAGALNIITRKAGDTFNGKVIGEIAEFDTYKGQVSLSGPIADGVSLGFSGFTSSTDGYVTNVTRGEPQDDKEKFGARLRLDAELSDKAVVSLIGDYLSSEGRFNALGDADPSLSFRVVDPNSGIGTGSFTESHLLAGQRYTTFGNDEQTVDVENYGFGATLNYDFGAIDFTSITGYRYVEAQDRYDVDGVDAQAVNFATTEQEILSQELRLTSDNDGPFNWIGGLYLFSESLDQLRTLDARANPGGTNILLTLVGPATDGMVNDNVLIERDGYALFGQGTYDITDRLDITVGLRYSYEDVEQTPDLMVNVVGGAISAINNQVQADDFDGFSPMASISYDWSENVMTYATVSTGFKAGGFTKEIPNLPTQNLALDNETSINYEIGLKSLLFSEQLLFNASVFRAELEDVQLSTRVNISTDPSTPIFQPATTNAGEAESQGFEIDVLARPADGLTLRGNVAYTDTEFTEYIQIPAAGTVLEYDRSGQAFPEVPEWAGSFGIDYRLQFPGLAYDIVPSATVRYLGEKFIGDGTDATPFLDIDSYTLLDAQVSIESEDWTFTLFANNVFDEYYFVNKQANQPILSVPGQRAYAKPGAPRQIGGRLTLNF